MPSLEDGEDFWSLPKQDLGFAKRKYEVIAPEGEEERPRKKAKVTFMGFFCCFFFRDRSFLW